MLSTYKYFICIIVLSFIATLLSNMSFKYSSRNYRLEMLGDFPKVTQLKLGLNDGTIICTTLLSYRSWESSLEML